MQRSRSQTIYRYLPGAVFLHEDGFIAKTWKVEGDRIEHRVNKKALLNAVDSAIKQWPEEKRKIPLPSKAGPSEFIVLEPAEVKWDVWPSTFQCSDKNCGRVRRFFNADQVVSYADAHGGLRCQTCGRRMEQLPYFAAHACGSIKEMYTPACKNCGREHVYLNDTGSFETSSWRCRNCGYHIQSTRFVPCDCGDYPNRSGKSFMRLYTVRDRRSHFPQLLSMINLDSDQYRGLQSHPERGRASLASYLGDEPSLARALRDLDAGADSQRMTPGEWEEYEKKLQDMGLPGEDIAAIRERRGPVEIGIERTDAKVEVIELAAGRLMLERAALLDKSGLSDRKSLQQAAEEAGEADREVLMDALKAAQARGVESISVSLQFPVLLAAFGYTRQAKSPKASTLRSFARKRAYGDKTPIFAVAVETEALLVEMSAKAVYTWLARDGHVPPSDVQNEREARLRMLEVFAGGGEPAHRARVLVHSLSHTFLRALDDGQSGFGESSLAEWVAPEGLTFATYVSSYQEFSIGAFWTLMHSRVQAWMNRVESVAFRCQNDPLCHNRSPRACERCLFLTFGCPQFNEGLSREVVMSFLRHQGTTP